MTVSTPAAHAPRPHRRWPARIAGLLLVLALALGGALAFGFLAFVHGVAKVERSDGRVADGIVALTGGPDRLADAVALLENGRARRLLITGVNPATSANELEKEVPALAEFRDCCVDLDRHAATTVGNAVETRRWAENRGFRSLIIVTSGYHMPRAMTELGRALPDVALIPYPVVTDNLREDTWWRDPTTVRLLFSEYVKYLLATAKLRLSPQREDFTTSGYTARL
jgi:uncharacterized SAM-binding protein YcdF (DUF218 family)